MTKTLMMSIPLPTTMKLAVMTPLAMLMLMSAPPCIADSQEINEMLVNRYGVPSFDIGQTGEDFVHELADNLFQGDVELAGSRILNDYRKGLIGAFALERPPARRRQK